MDKSERERLLTETALAVLEELARKGIVSKELVAEIYERNLIE